MKLRQRKRATVMYVREEVKDKVIRFRVTSEDFRKIQKCAAARKCTMTFFIDECLRKYMK